MAVSNMSAAFAAKATIEGQAANVTAGASAAAKCFAELFASILTEDGGEGAGDIALYYKDVATVQ